MASTLRQRLPVEVDVSDAKPWMSGGDSDSEVDVSPEANLPTFTPPTFTIKELLAAIPSHCYERSALRSSAYVVVDFAIVAALMVAASHIDPAFGSDGTQLKGTASLVAKWSLWSLYWLVAGWTMTGIWIIAHECGHQAFSASKRINDSVGLVLHSALLVPYHSWRISHGKHHAATGHMDRDQVYIPSTRSETLRRKSGDAKKKVVRKDGLDAVELLDDTPLYRLYHLALQQLFGWPAYLFANSTGPAEYPPWTNHFEPSSVIFDARHRTQILISDAGLVVVFGVLGLLVRNFGAATVIKYYGIPYLWVNHWLVMITYLQHTDASLPHYRASQWNFQRGALATIDRNLLGPVGPYLMHGICETHISHHLCSKIPHYHAWDATEALKAKLGSHYNYSDENMLVSLWKTYRMCRYVDDEGDIVFFKDAYGRPARTLSSDVPSDSGVEVETS